MRATVIAGRLTFLIAAWLAALFHALMVIFDVLALRDGMVDAVLRTQHGERPNTYYDGLTWSLYPLMLIPYVVTAVLLSAAIGRNARRRAEGTPSFDVGFRGRLRALALAAAVLAALTWITAGHPQEAAVAPLFGWSVYLGVALPLVAARWLRLPDMPPVPTTPRPP